MNVRRYASLFVIMVALIFGAQLVFLSHGDLINYYPYISPDGFDWYTEGVYLSHIFGNVNLPVLPILRPPVFVVLTAIDYSTGGFGIVLAVAYGVATFSTYFTSLKIIDLAHDSSSKKNWYAVPLAISFTIYPLNYFKPFILADNIAVALSLASFLLLVQYIQLPSKKILIAAGIVAIIAGLTQTYALIPYLMGCIVGSILNFKSNTSKTPQLILGFLLVIFIFIIITFIWRLSIPHVTTPPNFGLLMLNLNMFTFYASTLSFYLLPMLIFVTFYRGFKFIPFGSKIIILSTAFIILILGTLAFFYQWRDPRFTYYLWPWLLIFLSSGLRFNNNRGSYFFVLLMLTVTFLVPSNYWDPSWKTVQVSFANNWVGEYIKASSVDRKFYECNVIDCSLNNEFLRDSDAYVKSTMKIYNQIK